MADFDIIIIGGGLAGLATAYAALRAERSVLVLEKRVIGAGASGGLVGALSPHMPENWNPKRQYQLEALEISASYWGEIEALTGLSSEFRHCGRLQMIRNEAERKKAEMRVVAAQENWGGRWHWQICDDQAHPFAQSEYGYIHDTLSAKINPRAAIAALAKAVRLLGGEIKKGTEVRSLAKGEVIADQCYSANAIVIAAGFEGWPWLRARLGVRFGEGVKGQAALLRPAQPWRFPMVTGDGFYIVPHDDGHLAIGSTSERVWQNLHTDQKLDDLLARVSDDIPALKGAMVVERWAGVRPRAYRPDPLIGQLEEGIYVNMGAFKTGFSFMPKLAADLVAIMAGERIALPNGFALDDNLR